LHNNLLRKFPGGITSLSERHRSLAYTVDRYRLVITVYNSKPMNSDLVKIITGPVTGCLNTEERNNWIE
jgi:hypothetical protein